MKDGVFVASGSETSADAADAIQSRARRLERLVFEAIEWAGTRGLADFEIDAALSQHLAHGATARPRRCSLRDKGLIRNTGETVLNPHTNRRASLWALAIHVSEDRLTKPESPIAEESGEPVSADHQSLVQRVPFSESVESMLVQLVEHFDLIRLSDQIDDRGRLERLEGRLENARAFVARTIERQKLEHDWNESRQSGFDFGGITK